MKKRTILFCVLFISVISLHAQTEKTSVKDSIIFDNLVHDYGTIIQGADGNCEFTFNNEGQEPLILNNVRASCGCTVADWPKEPILSGKKGAIKVKYNTNIVGTFNKSITVYSNAINSTVVLRIKGNITAKQ